MGYVRISYEGGIVVEIVDNNPKYFNFVRLLRSDQRVQDGFIENVSITEEQQEKYMQKYSDNYIIALYNGEAAGFAGSIDKDIRVCVHPDFHKKGIGKALIKELMIRFPDSFAKVKIENEASRALFESCGFTVKYWLMEK